LIQRIKLFNQSTFGLAGCLVLSATYFRHCEFSPISNGSGNGRVVVVLIVTVVVVIVV